MEDKHKVVPSDCESDSTPCFRWSGQIALATAPDAAPDSNLTTLYYHGGQRMTSSSQTSNWWTNALVSLDLGRGASTFGPSFSTLERRAAH